MWIVFHRVKKILKFVVKITLSFLSGVCYNHMRIAMRICAWRFNLIAILAFCRAGGIYMIFKKRPIITAQINEINKLIEANAGINELFDTKFTLYETDGNQENQAYGRKSFGFKAADGSSFQ